MYCNFFIIYLHYKCVLVYCSDYMDSDPIQSPPSAALIVEEMKEQQGRLNARRLELIDTLT